MKNLSFIEKKTILIELSKKYPEIKDLINTYLIYNNISIFSKEIQNEINDIIIEFTVNHKPLSKIFECKNFYGYDFYVNENVLCPRAETEIMVDVILKNFIGKKVLELGTGSGAISIVLKKLLDIDITAIDICSKAIEIAKKNANLHMVFIDFVKNDWLNGVNECYDLLVSNPPYLTKEEINQNIELRYDPFIALYEGDRKLDKYIKISEKRHLFKEIYLEINPYYKNEIIKIFPDAIFIKDYNNDDRFIYVKNN